jgi:magnesium transporter
MTGNIDVAVDALNRRFFIDHPSEAAERLETMPNDEAISVLANHTVRVFLPAWRKLAPNTAASLLDRLSLAQASELLGELPPNEALQVLGLLEEEKQTQLLNSLEPSVAKDLRALMAYPPDTAGRLMDTRFSALRSSWTAREALEFLRKNSVKATRSLFLIDDENHLKAKVAIQDVAVADGDVKLDSIAQPLLASVEPIAPQSEVVAALEKYKLADLPVVNVDGTMLGIVYHQTLVDAVQADAMADIQAMVGASREERALSSPLFTVQKRMPWLQINLLTAFLAAAVVGLFEGTIAKFTALAVLLPVVAGQSGNAGAQALAVTMRGMALREISVRNWREVVTKEVLAGLMNGLAIAVTCGLGVYLWSGSLGLVAVIAISMVLAMVVAGFSGALVPILLTKFGMDPAQSSSIVLTTVTDIAGFFSFLGIATLLSSML